MFRGILFVILHGLSFFEIINIRYIYVQESPTNSNRIPTPADEGTVDKEKLANEEVHLTQNALRFHKMSKRWLT